MDVYVNGCGDVSMKKIRINGEGNVLCPLRNFHISVAKVCIYCDDLFGKEFTYINCKRGIMKDSYLRKRGRKETGELYALQKNKGRQIPGESPGEGSPGEEWLKSC